MSRSHSVLATIVTAGVLGGVASPAIADYEPFRSPSGAIECAIRSGEGGRSSASCYSDYTLRIPPDEDCPGGSALAVYRRGVTRVEGRCDPFGVDLEPLAYGRSITRGPFRCTSRRSGMTCRSLRSGHGFKIRKTGYTSF